MYFEREVTPGASEFSHVQQVVPGLVMLTTPETLPCGANRRVTPHQKQKNHKLTRSTKANYGRRAYMAVNSLKQIKSYSYLC